MRILPKPQLSLESGDLKQTPALCRRAEAEARTSRLPDPNETGILVSRRGRHAAMSFVGALPYAAVSSITT